MFRICFYCSHKIGDCQAYLVLCTLKGLPQIRKWSGKKGNLKVREKLECYFKLGNIYTGKVYFFKISGQGNVIVTMNSRGILKTKCLNSFMITKKTRGSSNKASDRNLLITSINYVGKILLIYSFILSLTK